MLRTKKAFTLIELMIVIAIIGVLAAVAIPAYDYYMKRARRAEAAEIIQGIIAANQQYRSDFRQYTNTFSLLQKYGATTEGKYTRVDGSGVPSAGNWLFIAYVCKAGPTGCDYAASEASCRQSTETGSKLECTDK